MDCWTLIPKTQWTHGDTISLHPPPSTFGLPLGLAGASVQHVTKCEVIGGYGRIAISTVQRQKLDGRGVNILPAGKLVTITCTWVVDHQAEHTSEEVDGTAVECPTLTAASPCSAVYCRGVCW